MSYSAERFIALRALARELSEKAIAGSGIPDPDGKYVAKMVRYFMEDPKELELLLDWDEPGPA